MSCPVYEDPLTNFEHQVAAMRRPQTYPIKVRRIVVKPTHMAMVFLTERHAWKLRRPLQHGAIDFRLRANRLRDTLSEYQLDAHFAPGVCVGLAGLQRNGSEESDWSLRPLRALDTDSAAMVSYSSEPVLCMHRLPGSGMMSQRIVSGTFTPDEGIRCVAILSKRLATRRAYEASPNWLIDHEIGQSLAQLASLRKPGEVRTQPWLTELEYQLRESAQRHRHRIAHRARHGQIRDGHGDLRPEHVCSAGAWTHRHGPAFIDALEFSKELRMRDTLSEISGLGVECEFLGSARIHQLLKQSWKALDPLACDGLWHHYAGRHALMRALHAAWHLDSPCSAEITQLWRDRSARWLELARNQFSRSMSVM